MFDASIDSFFFILLMTGAGWTEEQVLVLGAGHLVPMNQPLSAVVTRFSPLRNLGMMELGFFGIVYIYICSGVCVYMSTVTVYPNDDFPTTRMIADCSCAWTSLGCICIHTDFFTNIAHIFFPRCFVERIRMVSMCFRCFVPLLFGWKVLFLGHTVFTSSWPIWDTTLVILVKFEMWNSKSYYSCQLSSE